MSHFRTPPWCQNSNKPKHGAPFGKLDPSKYVTRGAASLNSPQVFGAMSLNLDVKIKNVFFYTKLLVLPQIFHFSKG
jgi:hypothetical protein